MNSIFWQHELQWTQQSPEDTGGDPPSTPYGVVLRRSPRSASTSEISPSSLLRREQNASALTNNDNAETPVRRARCDPPAAREVHNDCDEMEEERERGFRKRVEAGGADDSETEDESPTSTVSNCLVQDEEHAARINEADHPPSLETPKGDERVIPGAPEGWKSPGAPPGWEGPATVAVSGMNVPEFEDVDNPGGWSHHSFQPKHKRTKQGKITECLCHALPTGATPVPLENGKREVAGWEFHHQGWENRDGQCPIFRSGRSNKGESFP